MAIAPKLSASEFNALKGGIKQAKMQKSANVAGWIDMAGQVGAAIISTVYQVKNQKQQQKIVEQLDELSKQQMEELALKLQQSKDANDRLKELIDYLTNVEGTKIATDTTKAIKEKYLSTQQKTTKYIFWGVGITIALLGIVIIIKKRK